MKRNMKKVLLATGLIAGLLVAPVQAAEIADVKVIYDGEEVVFTDQKPLIINGTTYLPVRTIGEALGAQIDYDAATNSVTIKRYDLDSYWRVMLADGTLYLDNLKTLMGVDVKVINGRTMLPLRQVAEFTNVHADWNGTTRTINLIPYELMGNDPD